MMPSAVTSPPAMLERSRYLMPLVTQGKIGLSRPQSGLAWMGNIISQNSEPENVEDKVLGFGVAQVILETIGRK